MNLAQLTELIELELAACDSHVIKLHQLYKDTKPVKFICFGNEPTPPAIEINRHLNEIRRLLHMVTL